MCIARSVSAMLSCAVTAGVLSIAVSARAGAADTNSVACGRSPASWNAPAGALVLSRSSGIVEAVLTGVGEYYTHSMLSHGPGSLVTHSTMFTPGTNGWPEYCSRPINEHELKSGYPGVSQTDPGGIYTFLYLGNGGAERVIYQESADAFGPNDHGRHISDYLWSDVPYTAVPSRQDDGHSLYRLAHPQTNSFFNYVLYQYRNQESIHLGEAAWNSGSVCSTFLAFAHHMAGAGTVEPGTYDHETIVAAGEALYARVEDECSVNTSWLLDVGSTLTCFEGICDDAARQTRNCMASGVCDSDSDSHWKALKNDPESVAVSTSPDRLGGWSGHPYEGPGVSAWAHHEGADVEWNSPGDVYGCWF
jgi:hypothetical protein